MNEKQNELDPNMVRVVNAQGQVRFRPSHIVADPLFKNTGYWPEQDPKDSYTEKVLEFENGKKDESETDNDGVKAGTKDEFTEYLKTVNDIALLIQLKGKYRATWQTKAIKEREKELQVINPENKTV